MSKTSKNIHLETRKKEIWWFKLENNRGESNNGKLLAETISRNYQNKFIKIYSNNPFSEQKTGLNFIGKYFRSKATIIFVHSRANILFLILSKFLNAKTILIVNDYMRYHNKDKKLINKIKSQYHRTLHDISLRFCDNFIFISKATFNKSHLLLLNKKAIGNYKVIHPMPTYSPKLIKSSNFLKDKKTIDIIIITGYTNNKNSKLTLDLASSLLENNKKMNLVFHIFGLKNNICEKENYGKNIIFYEINTSTKKLIKIHQRCEFYLSLSKDEGYGIPLFESILLGLFPIVSSIESYLEILSKNNSIVKKSLLVDLNCKISINKISRFIKLNYNNARKNKFKMEEEYKKKFKNISNQTRDQLAEIIK